MFSCCSFVVHDRSDSLKSDLISELKERVIILTWTFPSTWMYGLSSRIYQSILMRGTTSVYVLTFCFTCKIPTWAIKSWYLLPMASALIFLYQSQTNLLAVSKRTRTIASIFGPREQIAFSNHPHFPPDQLQRGHRRLLQLHREQHPNHSAAFDAIIPPNNPIIQAGTTTILAGPYYSTFGRTNPRTPSLESTLWLILYECLPLVVWETLHTYFSLPQHRMRHQCIDNLLQFFVPSFKQGCFKFFSAAHLKHSCPYVYYTIL